MKMIAGLSLRAWRNRRLMRAAPRPANISTNEDADWAKKVAFDSWATALASSVLPVPGGPCSRMPCGTRAPSLRKRLGSRRNSTTSRSSSFDSSTPATSSHFTAAAEVGLISCGLVRGMRRSIQSRPKETIPRKMIGSQMTAQSWMSFQERPPPEPAGDGTAETLNESLPFSREKLWVAASIRQPSGSVPPGRGEDLAERLARAVAGEVARLLHGDPVAALRQHQVRDAVGTGQIDGLTALSGPALRERGRRGAQQHREGA